MIKIFLPNNINFIILTNKYIYLYNIKNFLLLNLQNYNIFFNLSLNIIKLKKQLIYNQKINKNFLNNFLFIWENFFFSKIYFIGKGFKLKKFKTSLYFNFNTSHINFILLKKLIIKKIQKKKLLIFSKNLNYLKQINKTIINIKKINPYTKRGLRKTKQIIYKKKNKNNI